MHQFITYPVSRIIGEGKAEFLRAWGQGVEKGEVGGGGGAPQSVRTSICAR